jgi:hypothetical protein
MIHQLTPIDHVKLLNDYNLIEPSIEWIDYSPQSKQFYLQLEDEISLKPIVKNTIIEEYIKRFNLHRCRLMWLGTKCCYSMHKDPYQRIHIPMITNDQCYFIFKMGMVQHIPVGYAYLVNATLEHTAINGSNDHWRLHIVGDVRN